MQITIPVQLDTTELYDAVFSMVAEVGCLNDWAVYVGWHNEERNLLIDDIDSDADSFHDGYTVTPESLGQALQRILQPDFVIDPDIRQWALNVANGDMGEVDATLADVLVQIACFNEIRYG